MNKETPLTQPLHRRAAIAAVTAMLAFGLIASPTLATGCNPNRPSNPVTSDAGKTDEITQPGTGHLNIEHLQAVVDNQIPYIAGGAMTWAFIGLYDKQNPNARVMFGLGWGPTQGLLSSTAVRALVTTSDGSAIQYDIQSKSLADFGGSDSVPLLSIEAPNSADPGNEHYDFLVNGTIAYSYNSSGSILHPFDGAESFEWAKIFAETYNAASQIPGTTSNTEQFGSITYNDQNGALYNYLADSAIMTGLAPANAVVSFGTGFVATRDSAC